MPLIKDNVYNLELHTNRQVLNIVYDLASKMYDTTESYVDNTLQAHENRLDSILDVTETYIEVSLDEGRAQGKPDSEILQQVYSNLRQFEFGNNDYIWIADYDAHLISHPEAHFYQKDMSHFADADGKLIIPEIINFARQNQKGLYKYKWSRLGSSKVVDKYSYVRDFPQWGIVMGAGVYIEDIEQEVAAQKVKAIIEINKALKEVKVANNGYLFVFDSQGNMLFHPNSNIHGVNFKEQLNPVTQHPIYLDLMTVADTGEELYYKWDKPNDQGNYIYEKLSLVRYLSGFDWYISSSVYVEDLKSSSFQLGQRIKAMGLLTLFSAAFATYIFAQWLTAPIKKLSATAYTISRGNLEAKTGIQRKDELGLLAESFDFMVERLRQNIQTLDSRVKARTNELSQSNVQLQHAITGLESTQSELRSVERRQRLILDAMPAQVAYLDDQLRYIFANQQYLDVFDTNNRGIEGKKLEDVVGKKMYRSLSPYLEQARAGLCPVYEYKLQHLGEEIITRRTMMPFVNESGKLEGLLTLSIDITKERETERRMAEASKMKAVGELSGGLAHDFNNLLTVILGNLLQLQSIHTPGLKQQKYLAPAIRATRRGADLTKRLLAFSRRQSLSPSWIEPEQLMLDLKELLAASVPDNIDLSTHVDQNVPEIWADASQIEDALVNLALNSVDAMPNGGAIRIDVSLVDSSDKSLLQPEFDDEITPGNYLLVTLSDTGGGFSEEALHKAYEPFYTTKKNGTGSGLGLSMVFGFVKQSKGFLRIQNNTTQAGATVDFLLPVVKYREEVNQDKPQPQPCIAAQTDSKLILLVEDNNDLRKMVCRQLVNIGYVVVEAKTGEEALTVLSGLRQIAGLVSDVVMPGEVDGYGVATAVKNKHPHCFVILMTGYSTIPTSVDFKFSLLQKPFGPNDLLNLIPEQGITQGVQHEPID